MFKDIFVQRATELSSSNGGRELSCRQMARAIHFDSLLLRTKDDKDLQAMQDEEWNPIISDFERLIPNVKFQPSFSISNTVPDSHEDVVFNFFRQMTVNQITGTEYN